MELVDRYDLKVGYFLIAILKTSLKGIVVVKVFHSQIVEDRVVSFLLSEHSLISIHKKVLISEQYNIQFLKVIFSILNVRHAPKF